LETIGGAISVNVLYLYYGSLQLILVLLHTIQVWIFNIKIQFLRHPQTIWFCLHRIPTEYHSSFDIGKGQDF
jgi:hypothetical protein